MKTIKDYHDLYFKRDALYFFKFRDNSLKNHGLCPSYYFSAPSLSWDVMLEPSPDSDMHIFFGKGTRGGISQIFKILRPKTRINPFFFFFFSITNEIHKNVK